MSTNLIAIKSFLGKYYSELIYSATQDKYKDTGLDTFFEQRFYIQNNKVQMIVDPSLCGLIVNISGNEIHISKELYDHPNIIVTNSLEHPDDALNPRSLYTAEIFSTIAYLVCQNHTMFRVEGPVDEPIYIKYKSEYETFYNSVVTFEVFEGIDIEIVEEIESFSALNAVTNYILHPNSIINLTTFYQNHFSALSFVYRNIISQNNSKFNHILLGKGSSNIIDETKIQPYDKSKSEFLGIINSVSYNFHSILYVQPATEDYSVNVDYRNIIEGKPNITFFPLVLDQKPEEKATISISKITKDDIDNDKIFEEISKYVSDIMDRLTLDRMIGVTRFYNNKTKFLGLP